MKLKNNKLSDPEFVKDWCLTILQFMSDDYITYAAANGGMSYKGHFERKRKEIMFVFDNIEKYGAHGKKGIKILYREISAMAREITLNKENLNKLLYEKFGESLEDEEKDINKIISKMIKRGKIINDQEFYIAKDYIDVIIGKGDDELAAKVEHLLYKYDSKSQG